MCIKGIIMCWCIVGNKAKLKQAAKIVKSEGVEVCPSFSSAISWGKLFQHITGKTPNVIVVPLACGLFCKIHDKQKGTKNTD